MLGIFGSLTHYFFPLIHILLSVHPFLPVSTTSNRISPDFVHLHDDLLGVELELGGNLLVSPSPALQYDVVGRQITRRSGTFPPLIGHGSFKSGRPVVGGSVSNQVIGRHQTWVAMHIH